MSGCHEGLVALVMTIAVWAMLLFGVFIGLNIAEHRAFKELKNCMAIGEPGVEICLDQIMARLERGEE